MALGSWVVAFIDNARSDVPMRDVPRPLGAVPPLFAALCRPDERVLVWQLADLAADRLAEQVREYVEVVYVVPQPTVARFSPTVTGRGREAYSLLEDSWRYQLEYLDPAAESSQAAEWGLTEAAYDKEAGPISLVEHRYILEGLHEMSTELKITLRRAQWHREAGEYRPESVTSAVLDRLAGADEPSLRTALKREIVERELSYEELLALPSFLAIGLFERLAEIVRLNRTARYFDIVARRAVDVFSSLTDEDLIASATAFAAAADSQLVSMTASKLSADPALEKIFKHATGTTPHGPWRRQEDERLRHFARYVTVARLLARLDWIRFLEAVDPAYTQLAADPAKVYSRMTAETRQRYRLEIATLAKWSAQTDYQVAVAARQASGAGHVGEVLLGPRRTEFEHQLGASVPRPFALVRALQRRAAPSYFMANLLLWALASVLVTGFGIMMSVPWLIIVLLEFVATGLAIELANFYLSHIVPPRFLAELDVRGATDVGSPLVVAVPTMLSDHIEDDINRLELRFLANRLPGVAYGLLTDWADAARENADTDDDQLSAATRGIAALASRYPDGRFFLFHRPREFAASESVWMGRERKRGKLEDFFDLIMTGAHSHWLRFGQLSWLKGAKYLISLDADTTLPPGAAARLFGAIAHPLNTEYGIVQPFVTTGYESATANGMTRLYHNQPGADPYLKAFSDIYFDLSGEAIYHGKGVINVPRFYERLHRRLPESRVLSHDLLEGSYVGVALATDIVLYDEFPGTLAAVESRDQRWTRGDWQLISWIGRRIPTAGGREATPLSLLSRFKIADNLRRSLVEPASIMALIMAAAFHQLGFALVTLLALRLVPPLLTAPRNRTFWHSLTISLRARGYEFSVLPYRAYRLSDAVIRAVWRTQVSHRRLLQWRTAAEASGQGRTSLDRWFSLQLITAALLLALDPGISSWLVAAIWANGLALTAWLEQPRALPLSPLTLADRSYLRRVALQTWQYFDDFMSTRNNYLPPDNYQVAFHNRVAVRTSPTNIGLGLAAWIESFEFGFTTIDTSVTRLEATLGTLGRLERYKGHFYNWYDVTTCLPVGQRFVSTVDSGNFVMTLWAVRGGLSEFAERPILGRQHATGLRDLLDEYHDRTTHWPDALYDELSSATNDAMAQSTAIGFITRMMALVRLIGARQTSLAEVTGPDTRLLERYLSSAEHIEQTSQQYLGWFIKLGAAASGWEQAVPELSELLLMPVAELPSLDSLASEIWRGRLASLGTLAGYELSSREIIDALGASRIQSQATLARIGHVTDLLGRWSDETDFRFLYNTDRRTFHIGYDVDTEELNRSYYDLLASEARTASYVAVASGQIPARHWWALGRNTRPLGNKAALLSWSGTMFEYLMPRLFLRNYPGTLLDQAVKEAVTAQRDQAERLEVPWGISESGHSDLDADNNYQYRAYGVGSLAVQAVPEKGTVVAPYASCLALMVDPLAALANLRELDRLGVRGRYGYYESVDYRRPYRPSGERGLIVYSYMAHHQGMALLALSNVLHDDVVVRRVERDARVAAASPLLQERPPRLVKPKTPVLLPALHPLRPIEPVVVADSAADLARAIPSQYLYTNGRLTTMLTARGGGYIRWGKFELNRWVGDPLLEQGGSLLYLSDGTSGRSWRLGAPLTAEKFRVESLPEGLSYEATTAGITSRIEVMLAPDDDVEIRYVRLNNLGNDNRTVGVTSFFDLALAEHMAVRTHPAFNQLFIATEALPEYDGVLAVRRHRSDAEEPLFVAHLLVNLTTPASRAELGNDRTEFIGRVGDRMHPAGLTAALSMQPSIDPAAIARQQVNLTPGGSVELAVLTIVGDSRDAIMRLAERYRQASQIRRVRQAAWARAEAELQRLQTSQAETELFQRLGSYLTYPNTALKAGAAGLVATGHGAAPEPAPIIVTMSDLTDVTLLRQVWLGAGFLERRGFKLSIVALLRSHEAGADLEAAIDTLLGRMESLFGDNMPAFSWEYTSQINPAALTSLIEAAHIVLDAKAGSLSEQLAAVPRMSLPRPLALPAPQPSAASFKPEIALARGGFANGGRTYGFSLSGQTTPAPWSNVIANSVFGTLVTERGSGFTWDGNSQQGRLTPWRNDPADDRPSDAWYVWEPSAEAFWPVLPVPSEAPQLEVEHSLGVSRWSGHRSGFDFSVSVTVPQGESRPKRVRLSTLKLTNTSGRERRIVVSSMAELSLGRDLEHDWSAARSTWRSAASALLFRAGAPSMRDSVIYAALDHPVLDVTTSRTEVYGAPIDGLPRGLSEATLSGRVGREHWPVAALRTEVTLPPGESVKLTSYLGAANNEAEALADIELLRRQRPADITSQASAVWGELTGVVNVRTPDPVLDAMLNYWLLYQVVSSRLWGRTGYYQSSGAFGFRDQLQDVMALLYTRPDLARLQILTAANHQYLEGDVQHWWQPLTMWGLRSRISDDRLWLPYVVARYVEITGDRDILTAEVSYIEGPKIADGEAESYHEATISKVRGTILDHCRRAVAASSARGTHGLPLMGSGDWCDGYNRVGLGGTGETVWGAWFLAVVCDDLAGLIDPASAEATTLRDEAAALRRSADACWDGSWYTRGYYDDGTALGSHTSDEGQIDSLAQSWAVLAGNSSSRARQAVQSAIEHLVDTEHGVVRLLAPSFDTTTRDPGYIRGYLPGVRENGGQYTHGSIWLAIASARLGHTAGAVNLLGLMMPTWHGATTQRIERYKIEPYVTPGDVYYNPGLEGRGGWSWYTGSAAWMYRAWIEEVLGLCLRGNRLSLNPRLPAEWRGFEMTYRYGTTTYELIVRNNAGHDNAATRLDGQPHAPVIELVDDGATHRFEQWLG